MSTSLPASESATAYVNNRSGKTGRSALVLPTLNAGPDFPVWIRALQSQTLIPERLLLVDSSSTDNTVKIAREAGFEVRVIPREEFSHGGTRQQCVDILDDSEFIVFLTQDALLASDDAIERLLDCFEDGEVGVAYGRQLPRVSADPIEAHARLFNYRDKSEIKTLSDAPQLGIKTVFISNSFAAYRQKALLSVGGFPENTIQNEDTYAASKMILNGWKIAYSAAATVYHSHRLSYAQEFQRYFDIGVFHARDNWIRESFGQAGGEGLRFVLSELRHVGGKRPTAIPSVLIRSVLKFTGYKLGGRERKLPLKLKRMLSSNKRYWQREQKDS